MEGNTKIIIKDTKVYFKNGFFILIWYIQSNLIKYLECWCYDLYLKNKIKREGGEQWMFGNAMQTVFHKKSIFWLKVIFYVYFELF